VKQNDSIRKFNDEFRSEILKSTSSDDVCPCSQFIWPILKDHIGEATVNGLIEDVRQYVSTLYRCCESMALLDAVLCFAVLECQANLKARWVCPACYVRELRYVSTSVMVICSCILVRPTIGDALAVKSCRHPIRDKFQKQRFIPNDIYATQTTRFQIVTGCNMSGKFTYIRSVALVQIMTQIGSFVPAAHASFPIVRQVFSRTRTDDSIEENASTFALEMREMAFILRNIDSHSLVIVDELGRGTSSRDGLTIALAISEALIASKALVWFATHFKDLVRILSVRSGVLSLHMSVSIAPDMQSMTMLYRVAEGIVPNENYGVAFARVFPFSPDVLKVAEDVCRALTKRALQRKKSSAAVRTQSKRKLLLSLREQLEQAMNGSTLEGEPLRAWLAELQKEFATRMKAVDEAAAEGASMMEDIREGDL